MYGNVHAQWPVCEGWTAGGVCLISHMDSTEVNSKQSELKCGISLALKGSQRCMCGPVVIGTPQDAYLELFSQDSWMERRAEWSD